MSEVERLLQNAFVPIEPPGALTERLERRLTELTDAAMHELADFDPGALRDPRRWARLAAAGLVAGTAGGARELAAGASTVDLACRDSARCDQLADALEAGGVRVRAVGEPVRALELQAA